MYHFSRPPTPSLTPREDFVNKAIFKLNGIEKPKLSVLKITLLGIAILIILKNFSIYICKSVEFINFATNLSVKTKSLNEDQTFFSPLILWLLYMFFLSEYKESWYFLIYNMSTYISIKSFRFPVKLIVPKTSVPLLTFLIFCEPYTFLSEMLCLIVLQISYCFYCKKPPRGYLFYC